MKKFIFFALFSTGIFSCKKNTEDLLNKQTEAITPKSIVISEKKSTDCLQVGTIATPDYNHRKYDVEVQWTKPENTHQMILVIELRNLNNIVVYHQIIEVKKDGAGSFLFSFSADTDKPGPWTLSTASFQFKSSTPCGQTSGIIQKSIL